MRTRTKNKNVKKRKKRFYTPKQMTQVLQEIGEGYTRKEAIITYVLISLGAIILGLLYNLRWGYIALSIIVCILMVPKLIINRKKQRYQKRRFDNANSYMSQMAQSFTSTRKILSSLKETLETFPEGKMNEVIKEAIHHIEYSYENVEKAKRTALKIIEREYNCEKIRTLHEFLLKAEMRGGNCEKEFKLLEQVREVWENAIRKVIKSKVSTRNIVTIQYFLLMLVCIFLLHQFPEDISIINLTLVQALNCMQIICFFIVFEKMDHRLTKDLLLDGEIITREKAEQYFDYIENFNPLVERKKNLPIKIMLTAVLVVICVFQKSFPMIGFSIFIAAFLFNIHNIKQLIILHKMKMEMTKAFPKWLFDIMLLIQTDNIPRSISYSIEKASPILQRELRRINEMLENNSSNPDAYMSFLARYQIPGVENTMRKLFSLHVGTGGFLQDGSAEVINVIISSNMTLLSDAEEKSIRTREEMSLIYGFVPEIPIILSMIGYGASLMFVIFERVMELL